MNSKMELKVRKRWEFAVGDTTTELLRRYIKACALDAYNYLEDMYDDDKEEE